MVRVVFIRHGMTNSNLRDARMAVKIASGRATLEQADADKRAEELASGPAEASGDTSLHTHKGGGVEEAKRLADYWSSMLASRAAQGGLHVYVSAMLRCLQTANPLVCSLEEKIGRSLRATATTLLPRAACGRASSRRRSTARSSASASAARWSARWPPSRAACAPRRWSAATTACWGTATRAAAARRRRSSPRPSAGSACARWSAALGTSAQFGAILSQFLS